MPGKGPTAVFRTDASARIGMGHLLRCLALAEALTARGWRTCFVVRKARGEDPYHVLGPITRDVVTLPFNADLAQDVRRTADCARERGAAVTIVDTYQATAGYLGDLRKDGPVMYIDDLARIRDGFDLLLNYNVGFTSRDYRKVSPDAKVLLGPRYCLMRREVSTVRAGMSARPRAPRVASELLVTLGGGAQGRTMRKVLGALAGEGWLRRATITAERWKGPADRRLRFVGFTKDLPRLMRRHPMALTAGGSTCYQLALLGVPMVILTIADNQRRIAEGMDSLGAGISLGAVKHLSPDTISRALRGLANSPSRRSGMSEIGMRAVDGKGCERVADEMERRFA